MKRSSAVFRAGTRPSSLALTQTRDALDRIEGMLTGVSFEMVPIASTGDGDRTTDLRQSPPDFFTRELDEALRRETIDLAVHSAKDLPDPVPEGLDWFWLPWREEPRDALVLRQGESVAGLPANPVIGVSSERRAAYGAQRFPGGLQKPIRGNIEERIAQVDRGSFDAIIMAGAALIRLGLADRISEWIPIEQLEVPDGQGYLAVTFRANDEKMVALRSLFARSVVFAGAGTGSRDLCTVAALRALQRADICLYDSLIDRKLLSELPPHAQAIDVGKRCGAHSKEQHETTRLLCDCARRSRRVVRLKGGDPGIFGRLAEETEALEQLGIPYRVIPGISALQAATTGTGMLLTRRDVSRGFCALTPRQSGGALARCDAELKSSLPAIYYMSMTAIEPIVRELLQDGVAPDTPAALVFSAGGADEKIIRARLDELPNLTPAHCTRQPGLILVGEVTKYSYNTGLGALQGRNVLLTCSEALLEKSSDLVRDLGGQPVPFPLIRLKTRCDMPLDFSSTDWIAITSPSSVRSFMELVRARKIDLRSIPRIMVCGRGTADEFEQYGLHADVQPESGFSAEALIEVARKVIRPGERILRLRSGKAGTELSDALRTAGAAVEDRILYDNEPIRRETLPDFDAVFFASASAVEAFTGQWGSGALAGKTIAVIGKPTAAALEQHGLKPSIIAREATVPGAIGALAEYSVSLALAAPSKKHNL